MLFSILWGFVLLRVVFGVWGWGRGFIHFLVPSSSSGFVLVSISATCFTKMPLVCILRVLFFSLAFFYQLLARPSSIRILLLSGFVVLFRILWGSVLLRVVFVGLSTLLFHRWSEVPSRGGVHGDSPYEKLPALQRCHLSVFTKCCFLELSAWPSSTRTLLLSGFVVHFSILEGAVLLRVVFVGLLSSLTGSF